MESNIQCRYAYEFGKERDYRVVFVGFGGNNKEIKKLILEVFKHFETNYINL